MDDSTRDGEPGGWEPERDEDWIFDLPEGARERQQSKNRDLRERLLQNLEDARHRRLVPGLEGQRESSDHDEAAAEQDASVVAQSEETGGAAPEACDEDVEPQTTPEEPSPMNEREQHDERTDPATSDPMSETDGGDVVPSEQPETVVETSSAQQSPEDGEEQTDEYSSTVDDDPETTPADPDAQPAVGDMPLLRRRRSTPRDAESPQDPGESESPAPADSGTAAQSPFAQPERQSPLSDRWADLLEESDQPGSIVDGMRAWVERSRARNQATRRSPEQRAREGEDEATTPPHEQQPMAPDPVEDTVPVDSGSPADSSPDAFPAPEDTESLLSREQEPGWSTDDHGSEAEDEGEDPAGPEPAAPEWDPSPIEDDDWGGEVIGESLPGDEASTSAGAVPPASGPQPEAAPSPTFEDRPEPAPNSDQSATAEGPESTTEESDAEGTDSSLPAATPRAEAEAEPEADAEADTAVGTGDDAGEESEGNSPGGAADIDHEFPWKDPHEEESVLVQAFNAHAESATAREVAGEEQSAEPSFADILGEDADDLLAEVSGRRQEYTPGAEDWGAAYSSSKRLSPSEDVLFQQGEPPIEEEFDVEVKEPDYLRERQSGGRSLVRNIVETGLLAILVFLAVRVSFQNFRVDGTSMSPTLADGEFLLVNKLVYAEVNMDKLSKFLPFVNAEEDEMRFVFHGPHRGDIVVLRDPRRPEQDLIKRVVGLPGETVEILNGKVYINGFLLKEPYIQTRWNDSRPRIPIPEDHYYVLGDNRNNSLDSRSPQVGLIPKSLILGKALLTYWPFEQFGLAPNSPGTSGGPELTTSRIPLADAGDTPSGEVDVPQDGPGPTAAVDDETASGTSPEGLSLTVR